MDSVHSEDGQAEDGPSSDERQPLPVGATELEQAILAKLDEDKAQDIVLIDLRGKSPMSATSAPSPTTCCACSRSRGWAR